MTKIKKENKKDVVIFQAKNGAIELQGDVKNETIWANQTQIVSLFSIDQSVVSRHIGNIFKDGEVDKNTNMQKMHIANSDKPVIFYSLDVVLAVGYRSNSGTAIQFRKWATEVLRGHIIKGYTINSKVIKNNYSEFKEAIENIKYLLPENKKIDNKDILGLISIYADTWFSLEAYDKDTLKQKGETRKKIVLSTKHLEESLVRLKYELIKRGEATDIFGKERSISSVAAIVGNIMQSFGGKDLYPSVEEKAAHL